MAADPPQPASKEPRKPKYDVTTLAELGPMLPLGVIDTDFSYHRSLATKRWNMKLEKKLGKLKDENRNANMSQHVSMILATVYDQLGPYSMGDLKPDAARARISQMFMGDVLYSYCWLRKSTMGNIVQMDVGCQTCGQEHKLPADLNTLEVKTAATIDAAQSVYELIDPFEIRGEKVERVLVGPAKWSAIESVRFGSLNDGAAKDMLIRASIHGVNDKEMALTEDDIEELGKPDIEELSNHIDRHSLGPDLAIEGVCPNPECKRSYRRSLDWSYNSFFGASSPSEASRS